MNEEEYLRRFAQARRDYVERARGESRQVCLLANRHDPASREQLRQLAHRIRGTAGTLGWVTISAGANDLEMAIQKNDSEQINSFARHLSSALKAMKADQVD